VGKKNTKKKKTDGGASIEASRLRHLGRWGVTVRNRRVGKLRACGAIIFKLRRVLPWTRKKRIGGREVGAKIITIRGKVSSEKVKVGLGERKKNKKRKMKRKQKGFWVPAEALAVKTEGD